VLDLLKLFNLFKLQGFQTPEETFLLGYLMAHGGEKHLIDITERDLKLIEHNPEFWLPLVKEDLDRIHRKICEEDIKTATTLLREQFKQRNAKVPAWLEKETL